MIREAVGGGQGEPRQQDAAGTRHHAGQRGVAGGRVQPGACPAALAYFASTFFFKSARPSSNIGPTM